MIRGFTRQTFQTRLLLAVLALLLCAAESFAVAGTWRRHARRGVRRRAAVVGTAVQSVRAAAAAQDAAASKVAADKAAAPAETTSKQKLEELQSPYKQG